MQGILKIFGDGRTDVNSAINNLPNHEVTTGNLNNILFWIYGIAGIAAVGVIVYGGIKYLTAQGEPGKIKQASQIIAYALIGLIVVMLAGAITAFATGIIGGAAQ